MTERPAAVAQYQAIAEGVKACVAEVLKVERAAVQMNTTLIDLGAESFDFMHLVFRIEKRFRVRLDVALAIRGEHTVANYVDSIAAALASQ